jgi:uncharacterized membrane protein
MFKVPDSPDVNIVFARRIYKLILLLSVIWLTLIALPPLLAAMGGLSDTISTYLYLAFSPLCHQDESRSFTIGGYPLAVCSRCAMIYAGFFAGVVSYPGFRRISNVNPPSLWFLFVPLAALALDVALDFFGIFSNSFLTRSVTGFVMGFGLSLFIIPGFIRFFYEVASYFDKKARTDL